MKKSSHQSHKRDADQETLSGSDKEEVSITNNLQEILLKKRDSNFAKSCKISEIYSGRITSASGSSGDKSVSSRKRQSSSTSKPSNCDLSFSSDRSRPFDSMPTLHNFASKFLFHICSSFWKVGLRKLSSRKICFIKIKCLQLLTLLNSIHSNLIFFL